MKTYLNGLPLPVNPMEELTCSTGADNETISILAVGDVLCIGNRKPLTLTIQSLFTDHPYPWLAISAPHSGIFYVNQVLAWLNEKQPVRLILTGMETDINILCGIETFEYTLSAGEEGEYWYKLSLKEQREVRPKKVIFEQTPTKKIAASVPQRTENRIVPKTYTVRSGDTLWGIAQKSYGSGARWKEIYQANSAQIKNPNRIYPNQILTIP